MRRSALIKMLVLVVVVAGLAMLFLATVRRTGSEPYTVRAEQLRNWVVTLEEERTSLGALLSLRPPPELPMFVSQQIFRRHSESLMAPAIRSMPLVLRAEFDRAFSGIVPPDELVALAENAGLGSTPVEPRCLASRRRPGTGPGQVFFVLFDLPEFQRYRAALADALHARGGDPTAYDPAALSPLLVIAASERTFETWLPRRAEIDECVAPFDLE